MGKIDPRVIKTRRKLKNAFLSLIATRKLSEINVKDLTQTAEVTRGTFYLHYKDKDTFIQVMMEGLIDEFFESAIFEMKQEDKVYPVLSLIHVFDYVNDRPDFFTVLLKESDAIEYQNMFSNKLYHYIENYQVTSGIVSNSKVPKELLMNFLIYGVLGYIDQWLKDGKIYANRYMAENLEKLLTSELTSEAGLHGFFVTDENDVINKLSND